MFIQHGSYQWIPLDDQPHLDEGQVLLYRGIQEERIFRYPCFKRDLKIPENQRIWNRYLAVQWKMLADSTLSFNTIHDRTQRCETGFLNDSTWLADQLAVEAGLDIQSDGFTKALWTSAMSSFSMERRIAELKFGRTLWSRRLPSQTSA